MSEGPLPPLGRINRSTGPWDTRSVAELSQTSFRTTLRGFDRSEVRDTLERIAADYRVLQIQNASLLRQLEELEGVLEAYRRQEGIESSTALTINQTVRRTSDEARAILMKAHAQAEETMARVTALANTEQPVRQTEHGQENFHVQLASTVSEMLAILRTAERAPDEPEAHQDRPCSVVLDPPVSTPAPPIVTVAPEEPVVSIGTTDRITDTTERDVRTSQPGTLVPISLVPRKVGGRTTASSEKGQTDESMDALLKKLDNAMLGIPSLNGE